MFIVLCGLLVTEFHKSHLTPAPEPARFSGPARRLRKRHNSRGPECSIAGTHVSFRLHSDHSRTTEYRGKASSYNQIVYYFILVGDRQFTDIEKLALLTLNNHVGASRRTLHVVLG